MFDFAQLDDTLETWHKRGLLMSMALSSYIGGTWQVISSIVALPAQ